MFSPVRIWKSLHPLALSRVVRGLFLFMVNGNAAALLGGHERHLHVALRTSLTSPARLGTVCQVQLIQFSVTSRSDIELRKYNL